MTTCEKESEVRSENDSKEEETYLVRGTQVAHEDAARGAVITQTQVLVPALSRQCSGQAMVEQVLVVKCADLARAGEREREREREREK